MYLIKLQVQNHYEESKFARNFFLFREKLYKN